MLRAPHCDRARPGTQRSPAGQRCCPLAWALGAALCLSVSGASGESLEVGPTPPTVGQGRALGPAVQRPLYSLKRCLRLAETNFPKIHQARAKLKKKRAQRSEAYTAPFSDWSVFGGLSPTPTVRGTPIYSPDSDVAISSDMGLGWQVGLEGLVPLWTFGKITNLWDAADAQIRVGEGEVQKEKNEVRLSVRKAYYGALLARDALALIHEAADRIDKYMNRLEKKVDEGEGDEIDLLKIKMHREELVARESEALKQEALALSGLRFLTGVRGSFDVPNDPLRRLSHRLAPLARYLSAARVYRPEVNMARAGVLAREAQTRVERAKLFPDIGISAGFRWTNAPTVTDQRNPFARDSAHSRSYGLALAFRYKIDFLPQSARLAQAEAELEEQRATERYALGGVGVEVEQAFREAQDAERRLEAYTRATDYAKRWLIQVQQGIDVGTMDEEDVVDPAKEYALKKFSLMSATLDYNMALARLALATGWDGIAAE